MSDKIKHAIPESDFDDWVFYTNDGRSSSVSSTSLTFKGKVKEEAKLREALIYGELEAVKTLMDKMKFNVDDLVQDFYPPLHISCMQGHYEIAKYLITERKADVNKSIDYVTPLLLCCNMKGINGTIHENIIILLLQHNASVNAGNRYHFTPFMAACKYGYTKIVEIMIEKADLDAVDDNGCTGLAYAVEFNHVDIVKMLTEAGANYNICNVAGYTPLEVARFHGFTNLLQFFPEKDVYEVPEEYMQYKSLRDFIPRVLKGSNCPEYFQEVNFILNTLNLHSFVGHFARAQVPLGSFLCMQEDDLKNIGIELFAQRSKILKGLLHFHLHHWNKNSIGHISETSNENFCDILLLLANHLQNVIIAQSSIQFVRNNLEQNILGPVNKLQVMQLDNAITQYESILKQYRDTVSYMKSFSPKKSILHIDGSDCIAVQRKNAFLKNSLKYTIILSLTICACMKLKRFF